MKDNEFKCAVCGGVFAKVLTDEEAEQQLRDEFGDGWTPGDCDMVCDDCYQEMVVWAEGDIVGRMNAN